MTLRLTPAAEADVDGVLAWYRERGHDLGDQFLQALDRCLETIEHNPLAFAIVHREIRRALLRRFPYCVFYIVSEHEIVALACFTGTAILKPGKVGETHNNRLKLAARGPLAADRERPRSHAAA